MMNVAKSLVFCINKRKKKNEFKARVLLLRNSLSNSLDGVSLSSIYGTSDEVVNFHFLLLVWFIFPFLHLEQPHKLGGAAPTAGG